MDLLLEEDEISILPVIEPYEREYKYEISSNVDRKDNGRKDNIEENSKEENSSDNNSNSLENIKYNHSILLGKLDRFDIVKIVSTFNIVDIVDGNNIVEDNSIQEDKNRQGNENILLNLNNYVRSYKNKSSDEQSKIYIIGIAALLLYVQLNWTGPDSKIELLLPNNIYKFIKKLNIIAKSELSLSNEIINNHYIHNGLLLLSKIILIPDNYNSNIFYNLPNVYWWACRLGRIHQCILENPVPVLQNFIPKSFTTANIELSQCNNLYNNQIFKLLKSRLLVEYALSYLPYYGYARCKNILSEAQNISGLQTKIMGSMGTRTRFQQEAKSQLLLSADSNNLIIQAENELAPEMACLHRHEDQLELQNEYTNLLYNRRETVRLERRKRLLAKKQEKIRQDQKREKEAKENNEATVEEDEKKENDEPRVTTDDEMDIIYPGWRDSPAFDHNFSKSIPLEDEAILEVANFNESIIFTPLASIDQAIILGNCVANSFLTSVSDELSREDMHAHCERVLRHPRLYSLHFSALFHRSLLEKRDRKLQFRAMLQLESLVCDHKTTNPSAERRMDVFITDLIPLFDLQVGLAAVYLANNFRKSALDIYIKLEYWEKVVESYIAIGLRDDADALLKKLLEDEPNSARLWCLLGEVWDSKENYLKSWEVSKGTYAKAMRNLGEWERNRDNFVEALECYKLALAINPLFARIQFNQGWCAMTLNQFDLAIVSFSRVVTMEPEHGEAWNNLATLHIQMKNYSLALNALEQSAKVLQDNWKVWDNYLTASFQLEKWNKVLYAFDRLCEVVQTDTIDTKTLATTMRAVINSWNANKESKTAVFFENLMNKLSNRFTQNPFIWQIYSEFNLLQAKVESAVELRKKMCRCLQSDSQWEKNEARFETFIYGLEETFSIFEEFTQTNRILLLRCDNFYFIKLEVDRTIVKANKSDLLATKKLEGVESVIKSFEQLSALSSKVELLLKTFDSTKPVSTASIGSLSDMMSMWK